MIVRTERERVAQCSTVNHRVYIYHQYVQIKIKNCIYFLWIKPLLIQCSKSSTGYHYDTCISIDKQKFMITHSPSAETYIYVYYSVNSPLQEVILQIPTAPRKIYIITKAKKKKKNQVKEQKNNSVLGIISCYIL